MKIVEVIPSLDILGGAEVLFFNLCIELKKNKDVELYVICLYDGINDKVAQEFGKFSIKVFFCNKHVGLDLKAAKKLKLYINHIKPNVIHTHLDCIATIFFSGSFKNKKITFFHTCHTVAYNDLSKDTRVLVKWLLKKGVIHLIGISDAISQTICNVYNLSECNTVYNGTKLFKNSIKYDKKYDFITVASFSPNKNQYFIIKVFDKFLNDYPLAKMIFLGTGPQLETCEKLVKDLNIEKNITFVGYTNDVEKYILQSKFFILASGYEGNPISIIEAMSAGLNIIATNVGGIPDVVSDRENGYLFSPSCEQDLLEIMSFVFDNPEQYLPIAERNVRKSKKYSIEICANEYVKLFMRYTK